MSPCHQGEHLWRPRQRIEAVSKGIRDYVAAIEVGSNGDRTPDPMADSVMLACAALEAAERVRAEALPAKQDDAERARRYRARKRDGRDAIPVAGVTGVTESVTAVTAVTRNGVTPPPDLLARLTEAADGNVAPGAVDVAPSRRCSRS
jgi:hypothetical protein